MACAIAGKTVNPFNALFYLPLAKPNHLWITLEYLTGSQEVVGSNPIFSMAGPLQPNASDPKKPSADTASVNYNAAFADLQQTLEQFGKSKIDVDHLGTQPTLEAYFPELTKSKS